MLGAGLLAKKAVERGLTVKPWVKTSLAPGSRVVTDYLERAGLMPYLEALRLPRRRLRLHDVHRQQRAAARRRVASAVDDDGPGGRRGAQRQPQLRGAHPSAGARLLPGVAAAGGGVRAGRHGRHRPDQRAARHRHERRSRSICSDIWPTQDEVSETMRDGGRPGDVPRGVRATSSTATSTGRRCRCPTRRAVRLGPELDVRPGAAVLRRACTPEPAPLTDIDGARVLGDARRLDHDRPHLARGLDPDGQPGRAST